MVTVDALEERVRRDLPRLGAEDAAEVARIVRVLVAHFDPQQVYAFGSQARGDADAGSDVDLLLLLRDLPAPPHRLAQEAYGLLGWRRLPVDLLFMRSDLFQERQAALASLPATVAREGKLLHDAATTAA